MRNIKKVILVTGSGKRIGREIVLGLSKNSKNFQFILHYNNSYKEVLDLTFARIATLLKRFVTTFGFP